MDPWKDEDSYVADIIAVLDNSNQGPSDIIQDDDYVFDTDLISEFGLHGPVDLGCEDMELLSLLESGVSAGDQFLHWFLDREESTEGGSLNSKRGQEQSTDQTELVQEPLQSTEDSTLNPDEAELDQEPLESMEDCTLNPDEAEPDQETLQSTEDSVFHPDQAEPKQEPLQSAEDSVFHPDQAEPKQEPLQSTEDSVFHPDQAEPKLEPLQSTEDSVLNPDQSEPDQEPLQSTEDSVFHPDQAEPGQEPLQSIEDSVFNPDVSNPKTDQLDDGRKAASDKVAPKRGPRLVNDSDGDSDDPVTSYVEACNANKKDLKKRLSVLIKSKPNQPINAKNKKPPVVRKKTTNEDTGTKRRKKQEDPPSKPVSPRKSARNKPSVDYSATEYPPEEEIGPGEAYYEGEFRCEEEDRCEEDSLDVSDEEWKEGDKGEKPKGATRRRKRGQNVIDFRKADTATSSYIFCDHTECKTLKKFGCNDHQTFENAKDLGLVVKKSTIQGAGDGLFNGGCRPIPAGTIICKYEGKQVSKKTLDEQKKNNGESSYAWEICDKTGRNVVGAIDPGTSPDRETNPLAFANCGTKCDNTTIMAFQFGPNIYYRVIHAIPVGAEILVYYGDEFASQLNIDVKARNFYRHEENWKTDAYDCQTCSLGFSTKADLDKHSKVCQNIPCSEKCGKKFTTTTKMEEHVRRVHSEEANKFNCDQCEKSYGLKRYLSQHKKRTHDNTTVECPDCKKMINSVTLAYHKRVVHGDKTYKCTLCGKDFAEPGNLKRHTNNVHFAIKNFKCSRCNKAFGQKSNLIKHTREVHEGIKYPCDECEYKASSSRNLCSHIKRVHRKVYSFPCEYCPSGFMSRQSLKRHMGSIHPDQLSSELEKFNEDNPNICPICDKRFSTKKERDIHRSRLHRDVGI